MSPNRGCSDNRLQSRLPAESLPRLASAMDAESRAAWTAMLVERGHSAAELASLPAVELARMLVG